MTGYIPIIPPPMPDYGSIHERAFQAAIASALKDIQDDFAATTDTWTNKPGFDVIAAHYEGADLVGEVSTQNQIYAYVNDGTEPHDILPVRAKRLHFVGGYKAKTAVKVIGSSGGGASGSDVFALAVHHPGSQGRQFDAAIVEKEQPGFEAAVQAAIQGAI